MKGRHYEAPTVEQSKRLLAGSESEDQFKDWLIRELKARGWLVMHSRPAQNRSGRWMTPIQGHPGFPDIVAVKAGRLLAIETKKERAYPRPDQRTWLAALGEVTGAEVHVLRPSDRELARRLAA